MSFLKGKWKEIENRKKLATKYGDNSQLVRRTITEYKPILSIPQHSFAHLLNVHYPIKQIAVYRGQDIRPW